MSGYQTTLREIAQSVDDDADAIDAFKLVAAQHLLGKRTKKARTILERLLADPTMRKDRRRNAEGLVALGVAARLLGADDASIGKRAQAEAESVLEIYGPSDDRLIAVEMGAAALAGDAAALARARARRLKTRLRPGISHAAFELLFLSDRAAREEGGESLALSCAEVFCRVAPFSPSAEAAQVMALLAHLVADLARALDSKAKILDDRSHARKGGTELFTFSKPRSRIDVGPDPAIVLEVEAAGRGALDPACTKVVALTEHLMTNIAEIIDSLSRSKAAGADKNLAAATKALSSGAGRVHAVLTLGDGVTMATASRRGLERRFAVAWDHVRNVIDNVAAKPSLEIRDT
jgi:hypothetical protein